MIPIRTRLGALACFALWSLAYLLDPRKASRRFHAFCRDIAAKEPMP
jgi:hypothetical protein